MSDTCDLPPELAAAGNVLLQTPPSDSLTDEACAEMTEGYDAVLFVAIDRSVQEQLKSRQPPNERQIGVVSVGETTRSGATTPRDSSDTLWRDGVWIKTVPDSSNYVGIAGSGNQFLEEHRDVDVTVCFHSLTALFQHGTLEDIFYLLHVCTHLLDEKNVVGHYHVDPNAHDDETLRTLAELFDAVVEVTPCGKVTSRIQSRTHEASASATEPQNAPDAEATYWGQTHVENLTLLTPWLWGSAVVTFGLLDILMTHIGLSTEIAVEASPVAARVIRSNGFGFIYVVKLLMFVLFYSVWRMTPEPYAVGIPLGLALTGVSVTIWNAIVLAASVA